MFNEAFWFFYILGLVDNMADVGVALMIIGGIITGILGIIYMISTTDGDDDIAAVAKQWIQRCIATAILGIVLVIFIPSQQALYAGGAQYAIQATELDDTLIAFKNIIDAQIEELAGDTQEQE